MYVPAFRILGDREQEATGYKYALKEEFVFFSNIPVQHEATMVCDQGRLYYHTDGRIIAMRDLRWDGSSGPTLDRPGGMVASLKHDCWYRLMRYGLIPLKFRKHADKMYRKDLEAGDVGFLTRWVRWTGLRLFGRSSAKPKKGKKNASTHKQRTNQERNQAGQGGKNYKRP